MVLYQPISKQLKLTAAYNFVVTNISHDKLTQNKAIQNIRIDSLTGYNTNSFIYNQVYATLNYNIKDFHLNTNLTAQQIQIKGHYALRKEMQDLKEPVSGIYSDLLPNIGLRYLVSNSATVSGGYYEAINPPSMEQLMPLVNINNPSYTVEGNPDLTPSHSSAYEFTYSNHRILGTDINISLDYSTIKNSIAMSRTDKIIENVGRQTIVRPENMPELKKQTDLTVRVYKQLIQKTFSVNINGGLGFGASPTLINGTETLEKNASTSLGVSFNLTLSQKLLFALSGNMNSNDMRYSQGNDYNQKVRSYSSSSSLSWQISNRSYFETNFNYAVYKNASLGFNRNIPLLNTSIRQILGKANRIEMRFSAFDIFDKNLAVTQSASQLSIISTSANTLARYFMFSLSYNLKGYKL